MAHVLPKGVGEGLISGFADCTHSSYPDFKLSRLPKGVGEGLISLTITPTQSKHVPAAVYETVGGVGVLSRS
jgi:hypothetical protein